MSSKTKTIVLIIGVIIACLLILQSFGLGIDETGSFYKGSIDLEISPLALKEIFPVAKFKTLLF